MITHDPTGVQAWPILVTVTVAVILVKLLPRMNAWLEKVNARMGVKLRERRKESLRQWVRERGIEAREEDLDMALDVADRVRRR